MNSDMFQLMEKLYPLHRTINCDDTDKALQICAEYIGNDYCKIKSYKAGEDALTWQVPYRYKVNEAWLEIDGIRIADFKENPLHIVSYSKSIKFKGKLKEIRKNIWSRKDRPNAIPWEFKYYERSWGFCVRHKDLIQFNDDSDVNLVIDVDFEDKPLNLLEVYKPGLTDKNILCITNVCHPYQVNDSLSGLVVGAEFTKQLMSSKKDKYGYYFLIVPETIGSICWFADNEDKVKNISYAWFFEMLGHDNRFILQKSRQGNSLIDKAFEVVLKSNNSHGKYETGNFREIVASDEMVSNGPGYDIPTPSLTRWPYPEYHTSDDNPDIIKDKNLKESLSVTNQLWSSLNQNIYVKRLFKGPIMLSRYGLWVDWREDRHLNLKTEAIMMRLEGDKSLIDIAFETSLPLIKVLKFINKLKENNLVELQDKAW